MHLEAIGEIFNLFNAINPSFGVRFASTAGRMYLGSSTATNLSRTRLHEAVGATPATSGNPEQRVGQIGFRFTF